MCVWRGLDTKTVLKRLYILGIPFVVLFLIAFTFAFYQDLLVFSFRFFTGYGLFFEYTSLGLKYFGQLMVPVITDTTVIIALLFILSLPMLFIIGTWINVFIGPFKDVKEFRNYGKVYEEIRSFMAKVSIKEKLFVFALTLTSMLTCLFASLWFISLLGIFISSHISIFLGLYIINLLGFLYFGFRIERALKKHAETVQT